MTQLKKRIIIDCDPGADDAIAIIMAVLSDELDVIGITVTYGNNDVDTCFHNTKKVLALCHRLDIPVYKGAARPLEKPIDFSHGYCGLKGMLADVMVNTDPPAMPADVFLAQSIKEEASLWILSMANMTNIAKALSSCADDDLRRLTIVSISGYYGIRKASDDFKPRPEWNFALDPDAYAMVAETPARHIYIGLDATAMLHAMPVIPADTHRFADFLLACYDYNRRNGLAPYSLFVDALAVGYVLDERIVRLRQGNILVHDVSVISPASLGFQADPQGSASVADDIDIMRYREIIKRSVLKT